MNNFKFEMRTSLLYANDMSDVMSDAVRMTGGSKAFVITDPGVAEQSCYKALLRALNASGIPYVQCNEVENEPSSKSIDVVASKLVASCCDLVIGFGGGSSLDTAKAAAIIAVNGGESRDYFGVGKVRKTPLPVIAVPTTAGSGADVTRFIAIVDSEHKTKAQIMDDKAAPLVSVLCPSNLIGIPQKLIPAIGFDSMTHAVEGYINAKANGITEPLSLQAFTLISQNLVRFYRDNTDVEAAGNLLLATSLGCLACNMIATGDAHCIARSVGGRFHGIPHGAALSVVLPHVLNFNIEGSSHKLAKLAKAMALATDSKSDTEAAQMLVLAIQGIREQLGLPDNYRELGVDLACLDELARESKYKSEHGSSAGAPPRKATLEEYRQLITDAYYGVKIVYR